MSKATALNYELTGDTTKLSKGTGKRVAIKSAEQLSTSRLLWIVVARHKTGLLATWAVIMTALYIFPPLPDVLLGLLGR